LSKFVFSTVRKRNKMAHDLGKHGTALEIGKMSDAVSRARGFIQNLVARDLSSTRLTKVNALHIILNFKSHHNAA
jgi:hypothetical protein